jgi:hypothetical protein
MLLTRTVGEPGTHGAGVTGTQGIGVNTPRAAAVAAATVGFASEVHIPNGGMLAIGILSIILAAGGPPAVTGGPFGIAINELGAAPKLHMSRAPEHTGWAIDEILLT